MKNKIFAIAFIAFSSITSQLLAQDATSKSSGYDLKKAVKCRVITTDDGSSIIFDTEDVTKREAGSGMATGKRQYQPLIIRKEFSISSSDNAVTEIKSPRDVASGQATGKRMHKPLTITKELDKSTPLILNRVSSPDASSGQGSGKVSIQDIHFVIKSNGKIRNLSVVDGECDLPTDCPNGECTLTASWSWGMSQSGKTKRCSVDFLLEIEDGVCHAINTKGTGATR
ncbi:type VI secretion system tube protein Hcp [Flavobacterium sp.]|uniref:type VI secretion system tube protein Hcp n=1 Tax=Flavobacterium sp. TaxID=239 RepID=UPI001B4B11A5|nr:type VI secretion system tube protein Hcp [Flavobacterium sp.]MBP6181883.1 type VI secretion system tube protein Hcp [Flavobacterium sp.]